MAWTLAPSLKTLLAEINAAAPNRSKASDGTIGDSAHAARKSDHNPNAAGVVRALDVTHDPKNGVDCNALAANIIGTFGKIPALTSGAYVIWQGRIWSFDKRHLGWRDSSGHDKHMHVSVATAASGYNSTAPWGVMGDDMSNGADIAAVLYEGGSGTPKASTVYQRLARVEAGVANIERMLGAGGATSVIKPNEGAKTLGADIRATRAVTEAVADAIKGIDGVDTAAVERAVHDGVAKALASIQTTVTVKAEK